jgi:hypothetical protein
MSFQSDFLYSGFMGNLTTLRASQHRCRMTDKQAASFLGVSPETYRRWRTDRKPNLAAVKLMAVMAGYVPWSGWEDWEVHGGRLFPPGYTKHGFTPGDLFSITFLRQSVQAYRLRVEDLEAKIQVFQRDKPAAPVLSLLTK